MKCDYSVPFCFSLQKYIHVIPDATQHIFSDTFLAWTSTRCYMVVQYHGCLVHMAICFHHWSVCEWSDLLSWCGFVLISPHLQETGVPQGSVLGVTLYSLWQMNFYCRAAMNVWVVITEEIFSIIHTNTNKR